MPAKDSFLDIQKTLESSEQVGVPWNRNINRLVEQHLPGTITIKVEKALDIKPSKKPFFVLTLDHSSLKGHSSKSVDTMIEPMEDQLVSRSKSVDIRGRSLYGRSKLSSRRALQEGETEADWDLLSTTAAWNLQADL